VNHGVTVRVAPYAHPVAAFEHHSAFGQDAFGRAAEKTARFFGTPQYIIGQTFVVALWVVLNAVALVGHWDPYPFILLNLGFSLQAAYAAPLILLAQTRQADRDKVQADALEAHRSREEKIGLDRVAAVKAETDKLARLLESNTDLTQQDKDLTEQVAKLTRDIHQLLTTQKGPDPAGV
jgi:uncharacterized membrane protein